LLGDKNPFLIVETVKYDGSLPEDNTLIMQELYYGLSLYSLVEVKMIDEDGEMIRSYDPRMLASVFDNLKGAIPHPEKVAEYKKDLKSRIEPKDLAILDVVISDLISAKKEENK